MSILKSQYKVNNVSAGPDTRDHLLRDSTDTSVETQRSGHPRGNNVELYLYSLDPQIRALFITELCLI